MLNSGTLATRCVVHPSQVSDLVELTPVVGGPLVACDTITIAPVVVVDHAHSVKVHRPTPPLHKHTHKHTA